MEFLEDIIVDKIRTLFVLEFFDVSPSTESFLHFAQKNDSFNIVGSLILGNLIANNFLHFRGQCIEVFFAIHVDEADFIFDFGLYFVEGETGEERTDALGGNLHKDICKTKFYIRDNKVISPKIIL